MKKKILIVWGLILVLAISGTVSAGDDEAAVEQVIKKAYFNGAFNDLDTENMKKGFHPDFAIFSAKGKKLSRYPIATWIQDIEKKKNNPDFDPDQAIRDCRIVSLDITGGAAAAKIQISKDNTLIFTDYLSLLKFNDGWKIVAKVYHRH